MPRAQTQAYNGAAPSADAPGASISRDLTYEAILEREGVKRDQATGLLYRPVPIAAPEGSPPRFQKHFVALSAEEAQKNSRPGVCWDFYVQGARCTHGCDRPMSGWAHRGRKFSAEHHHVTDIPRDEIWEEIDAAPVPAEV